MSKKSKRSNDNQQQPRKPITVAMPLSIAQLMQMAQGGAGLPLETVVDEIPAHVWRRVARRGTPCCESTARDAVIVFVSPTATTPNRIGIVAFDDHGIGLPISAILDRDAARELVNNLQQAIAESERIDTARFEFAD